MSRLTLILERDTAMTTPAPNCSTHSKPLANSFLRAWYYTCCRCGYTSPTYNTENSASSLSHLHTNYCKKP